MEAGASPYLLPDDVPQGSETVLNTDRYLYASFLNRIADSIYQPWVDEIDLARETLESAGKHLEANLYVTKLSVVLNDRGDVVEVQVLKSCGVEAFDEAPKRAFWRAAVFPNPPGAFFTKSDTLRLYYEFHLKLGTKLFEILPWVV